tara:strand:- start:161 stop:868 length:708 start_codon:yes stop_codon:yes gene_type:complete
MALPKIDQPLFEITIPSTGKKARYRPFTVKEEKILLIAQESKDMSQIILSIQQVLGNCVTDAVIDQLAVFDLEYLILNIRAKSVNNEISFGFQDIDTEERIDVIIDVNDIEVQFDELHDKKIELNDQYYIMMRYPTLQEVQMMQGLKENSTEQMFATMISCIETLVDKKSDEVFKMQEFSSEEVSDFVDGFTSNVIEGIQNFYATMPKLKHVINYKDNTGKDKEFVVEGMDSFFT